MKWLCLVFFLIGNNLYSQFIDSTNIDCNQDRVLTLRQDPFTTLEYHWSTDGGFIQKNINHTIWLNLISEEKKRVTVSVWGYDPETECSTDVVTAVITLDECMKLFIPNAFSPNGDGTNDYFRVYGNVDYFFMKIYNRWGENIFTTRTIDFKWDGSYKGVPCPMEVYVYFIIAEKEGKTKRYKGDITLIR